MKHRTALERIGSSALDAVFPPRCGICGTWGRFICAGCEAELQPARPPRCSRCWRPLDPRESCPNSHDAALDSIRASFVYEGVARALVHALKYRGLTALAQPMVELIVGQSTASDLSFHALVPVPLTPARKRTRGHNQAERLARELATTLDIEHLPGALARRRGAPPQARSASADERRRNVAGAFVVAAAEQVAARNIVVVDDVTTTGATLAACADALRSAGAASVCGLAFARED